MQYKGLIVGLGNPGNQYTDTRHNMGFMLVDHLLDLASYHGRQESLNGSKFKCELWRATLPSSSDWWLFAKPLTYMNLSGQCVQPLLAWHKLGPQDLIVLHDELDIKAGQLRFKFGGGNAGHNGLKSITQSLGTPDFYRLRMGIGRPSLPEHGDVSTYVLARPKGEEKEKLEHCFPKAVEVLNVFLDEGLKPATAHALSFT